MNNINENIYFADLTSNEMVQFEKEITYFYEAKYPDLIAAHYLKAIEKLERLKMHESLETREEMLVHLVKAYEEIAVQTHLKFNIEKAAALELSLIISQVNKATFDDICEIMINLYKVVFNSHSLSIQKAAMLRTFLYQYKILALQNEKTLSTEDKQIMLALARKSENELKTLIK